MFDWRAKIGLLISARNQVLELDFNEHRPSGVTIHTARINKEQDLTNVDTMINLAKNAEQTIQLLVQAKVEIAVFGCTAASFVNGPSLDLKISETLQRVSGITTITASTAVSEALRALGAKKISIVTPYVAELNGREEAFFRGNGFEILSLKGMNIEQSSKYPQISPAEIYRFGINNFDEASDCLFVSCTNIRAMEAIPYLEMHLGKPVITSNQASLWKTLRRIGIKDQIENCGQLLRRQ